MLNLLIFVPIVAAVAVLLGASPRFTPFLASAFNLVVSIALLIDYDRAQGSYQFLSTFQILPELDLKYFVGADGLSLVMFFLTALVTLAAVWVTPKIEKQEKWFYACLLFISAGAMGAFASLDLFFFYAFHELALIPTFLLIGIWGSGDRYAAAWKITIYLALGSFILLIGLIGLYQAVSPELRTFDIPKLQELAVVGQIDPSAKNWVYLCLLIGFGILVSLFPFHSWAPPAYASAPAPAAMLHAGVLKKFGLYGMLRIALPILPEGAQHWTNLLLVLLVGNILYIGFATIAQRRLDAMLGYSSVMHMGYAFLGIASLNVLGVSGAALLMLAHGISIAALFAIAGELRKRTATLDYANLGGLAKKAPFLGLAFGLAAFASIGLPGFANFASEIMVFFGAFQGQAGEANLKWFQLTTIAALWGVVISAVYMLRGYRAVFMGPADARWSGITDTTGSMRWPIILLLAALILAGFWPQLFLNFLTPSVTASLLLK